MDDPVSYQAFAHDGIDLFSNRVARRHQSRPCAHLGRERNPACGGGAREVVRFDLRNVGAELLEGALDVACESGLDGGLEVRVALAHDLFHHRRLHARRLELRKGFPGIHGVELFRITH